MSDQTPYSSYPDSPQWQHPPQGSYPPTVGPYTPPPYGQPQPGFAPQAPGYPPQQAYVPVQYPQPAYPPPNQYPVFGTPPAAESGSGMAVASLVLGILSLVPWWILYVGLPIAIVGIIMGALGRRSVSRRGIATAGLVCSIIGLAVLIIFYLWIASLIHSATTYPY